MVVLRHNRNIFESPVFFILQLTTFLSTKLSNNKIVKLDFQFVVNKWLALTDLKIKRDMRKLMISLVCLKLLTTFIRNLQEIMKNHKFVKINKFSGVSVIKSVNDSN